MKEKKKRCIIGILCLDILLLILLVVKEYNFGEKFDDYIVSEEKFEEILKMHGKSESALVSDLIFNENPLFFDEMDGIFYYSMLDDLDAYNPRVKVTSQEAKVDIAFKERKITDILIGENMAIDFVIYTDKYCSQYRLKCTTLPIMNIDVESEVTGEDVQMKMQLFDNGIEAVQRTTESEGLIHIRGGSTKSYPKQGYKVSLVENLPNDQIQKNKCSLLGMRQDDDWILYAAYNDQEKIRNVFSSNLWLETCGTDNTFRLENGMRYKYIELFFNGQYWGLYALGYPIDDLQMNIEQNTKECIFKKVSWDSEYPIAYADDGTIAGYRISSNGKSDWTLLYDFYEKLNSDDTEDSWFYSSIDLENAVDYMLFTNLIQGIDNISYNRTKNMYFTVKLAKDGTYKHLYTPWDMDITWGNTWSHTADNLTNPYALDASFHWIMESGPLYRLLIRHNETAWMTYLEKYEELRNGVWSDDAIRNMLKKYEHQIFDSGAYLRDMDRWPDGSYENPELKLSVFMEYVVARLHKMDEYYERVAEVRKENVHIIRSVQYEDFKNGSFIIKMGDGYDEDVKELLEYIGISVKEIPEDCEFIFYSMLNDEIEYEKDEREVPFEYDWTENNDFKIFFKQKKDSVYQLFELGK